MGCRRVAVIAFLALLAAGSAQAATLEVGPDKPFKQPSEAVKAAKPGDTIRIAPGQYYDCAIVQKNNLTIEGAAPGAVLTDTTCQGKALLVIGGNDITIRNLTLQRARVPDHNGAGIRAEGGNLTIENVQFINNEEGILTTSNPNASIRITGSAFIHNGACQGGCAHGIYTGQIRLLHVEHTRFFETQHTHNIKSRALTTEVIDCDIEDGPEGTSSYQIDVPSGGSLIVEGNTLEKGPHAENYKYSIIIGEEGVHQATDKIEIRNNTFINDNEHPTTFLRNLTATPAVLVGNKFKGQVTPLEGDGSSG
jgi:hypothetical protein